MKAMTMAIRSNLNRAAIGCVLLLAAACSPTVVSRKESNAVPTNYLNQGSQDYTNVSNITWRQFFTDANLVALIDTALHNNQEYNIVMQEIEISRNEVRARKGEYLPFLNVGVGAGVEKVGEYTRNGSVEANNEVAPGKSFHEPLPYLLLGSNVSW
jgi:outer membrane protein TolC